jgi:pentatricopeptide repeat protein
LTVGDRLFEKTVMLLCRAASSLRFICAKHVLIVPRLLSAGSKPPDKNKPPFSSCKDRSVQRSSSSSDRSAHRSVAKPFKAAGSAIQKSQALTAHIGALGRQGRWQDVLRALETAEGNGQKLFVNNLNAAIAALTRSAQPERALQLVPLMQDRGMKPTVVTYTALIDACSNNGQWQEALELLNKMLAAGIEPDVASYNSAIDACSCTGEWQVAVKLLREMQQQQLLVPNISTYNRVINACQNGGNWQLAIDLVVELQAAGLEANGITYKCVIEALYAANQHEKAEELYAEMFKQGLIQSHWSATNKGKLDFHEFTEGMAAAAMRVVLRDMVSHNTAANENSSSSVSYVHPIANDLHIITGHGTGDGKQGSVLQPVLIAMLKQLSIECKVHPYNRGRLVVSSSNLKGYAARVTAV